MELLIKVYNNKPSRIGIKYRYGYEARKPYEDLIRKYRGETFSMKLEPANRKLNLTLQSLQSGTKILYKELEYKLEQLKKLNMMTENAPAFEFVHIYSEANALLIAKPFKKEEFISITSFEIIGNEHYK